MESELLGERWTSVCPLALPPSACRRQTAAPRRAASNSTYKDRSRTCRGQVQDRPSWPGRHASHRPPSAATALYHHSRRAKSDAARSFFTAACTCSRDIAEVSPRFSRDRAARPPAACTRSAAASTSSPRLEHRAPAEEADGRAAEARGGGGGSAGRAGGGGGGDDDDDVGGADGGGGGDVGGADGGGEWGAKLAAKCSWRLRSCLRR